MTPPLKKQHRTDLQKQTQSTSAKGSVSRGVDRWRLLAKNTMQTVILQKTSFGRIYGNYTQEPFPFYPLFVKMSKTCPCFLSEMIDDMVSMKRCK